MSAHNRKIARQAVIAALTADDVFSEYRHRPSWSQSVDVSKGPCWGVMTPRGLDQIASKDEIQRTTQLNIVFKMQGGDDLDDLLDAAAEHIEAVCKPAIRVLGEVLLSDTTEQAFQIDGDGASRVGTAQVVFSVTSIVTN